jgi:methyltransferase
VTDGPYRYLDHPNYVAVVAELAALPLALGAWRTAAVATVANATVLRARLTVERAALA